MFNIKLNVQLVDVKGQVTVEIKSFWVLSRPGMDMEYFSYSMLLKIVSCCLVRGVGSVRWVGWLVGVCG